MVGSYLQSVAKVPSCKTMMNELIPGRKYWLVCMRLNIRISQSAQPVWSEGKSNWQLEVELLIPV